MNALYNANILTEPHNGPASIVFPLAKSASTGVSVGYVPQADKHWYVFRILYGQIQKVADSLIAEGHYAYVAKVWKVQQNRDGKKRKVLMPFLNLLFVYVTDRQAELAVRESAEARYITYYYNHFQFNAQGKNPPVVISQRDMENLIRATAVGDEHVMEVDLNTCRFASDDYVRITDGPFKGIIGRVARIARQHRVVIEIPGLRSGLATAYIPPYFLEKASNPH